MRKKILLFISIAIFTMLILFGIEHFSSLNKKTQEISSSETQPTENTKDTELVIDIPKKEMAHHAVNLLLDRIHNQHSNAVRIELPCRLIVRESCSYCGR